MSQATSIPPVQSPVIDLVLQAYEQAEAGKYTEALATIKSAKLSDSRNIYIIALEKQFTKLLSLPANAAPARAQRQEIMETLPSLLERAIDAARQRDSAVRPPAPVTPKSDDRQEKEAKLQAVKNTYFKRADEYLERGEYQSALSEVRRVSIIDPGNRVAKEYELKIQQLSVLQARNNRPQEEKKPAHVEEEKQPVPQQVVEETVADHPAPAKKSRVPLVAAIFGVVIALAAGGFFLLRTPSAEQGTVAQNTAAAPQNAVSQEQPASNPVGTVAANTASQTPEQPLQNSQADTKVTTPVSVPPAKVKEEPKQEPPPIKEVAKKQVQEPAPKPKTETPKPVPPPGQNLAASTPVGVSSAQPNDAQPSEPFVPVEKQPQIVKLEKPRIPAAAAMVGSKGKVVVRVQIDPQGKPLQAVVLTSTNKVLDDAVIEAVMNSKYTPGLMTSGPVTTWLTIPFNFK